MVFFLLAAATAGCADDTQSPPSGSTPDSVAPEIVEWLRSSGHPFDTAEPGGGVADLEFLREMIGSARVVALGEATHGTHEFVTMKHRIFEFLVEEMGFNTFALEATWPESNRVNDYVHGGEGDPLVLLSGLYFWTCCPEEMLDMVRWMRAHNRDPGAAPSVSFFGFDMQYPGMPIHNVLQFLGGVDPAAATWAAARYDCMMPFTNGPGSGTSRVVLYGEQPLEYRNACLADLEAVHDSLGARRDLYVPASSEAAFAAALQNARILVQFEITSSFRIPGARDQFMAENVSWLLERAGPGAKIVLSAHNGHVADDPWFGGGGSMGHHLRTVFGNDLVIVGFDFHHGGFEAVTVTDAGTLAGLNDHTVEYPPRESYEYYFHPAGMERFALDLRDVPMTTATSWLPGPRPMRYIGAGFAPSFPEYTLKNVSLPSQFDLVIYFDSTTASHPLQRRFPDSW